MNKRIVWIDYAKIIGIFLVIWGHTMLGIIPIPIPKIIIYSFHMPLFFLLSGFLYKQKEFKLFCSETVRTLLIPFLLFNCIEFVKYINTTEFNVILGGVTFVKDYLTAIYEGDPLIGPSWFVLCLIWIKIISFVFVRISKGHKLILLFVIIGFIIFNYILGNVESLNSTLCLGQALLCTPFFLTGYLLKQSGIFFYSFLKNWKFGLIPIVIWLIFWKVNGNVGLNGCSFGNNLFLMYFVGFSGSFIIIKLCTLIKREYRLIKTLSMGTLVILCTHGFILNMTINKYPIFPIESIVWYVYTFIGCILILLAEYFVVKVFYSKYLRIFVGGRKLQ